MSPHEHLLRLLREHPAGLTAEELRLIAPDSARALPTLLAQRQVRAVSEPTPATARIRSRWCLVYRAA